MISPKSIVSRSTRSPCRSTSSSNRSSARWMGRPCTRVVDVRLTLSSRASEKGRSRVEQRLAQQAHYPEVASSNPAPAINPLNTESRLLYSEHGIDLWRGDCGLVLTKLADTDLLITDPPWHYHGYTTKIETAPSVSDESEAIWF